MKNVFCFTPPQHSSKRPYCQETVPLWILKLGNGRKKTKRLSIAQINKNTEEKAEAHYNLGRAYCFLEDFHRAIEYLKQHLSIAEEVGNRAGSAGCAYGNLGFAYQSLGDSQRAIEYHNQHLRIAKEVGDRAGEGLAYGNLGLAYHSHEEFQQAIEYHNQHLRNCQGSWWQGRGRQSLWQFQRYLSQP